MIECPRSFAVPMKSIIVRLDMMSRPSVGSSRMSSGGSCTITRAIDTRWGWPASWVGAGVGLFVLKDAILFPFVKHAYSVAPGKGAAPEPGSRVIAAEDIDPKGYARIAAELEVSMYTERPTYFLGYLIGMVKIQEMRDEWIARYGEPEEPRELYDALLKIGSLPPSLVRAELLAR